MQQRLCLKCGSTGHTNKSCKNEVTSFGLICYKFQQDSKDCGRMYQVDFQKHCGIHKSSLFNTANPVSHNGEPLFMLVERKDTIGFINLIQGCYPDGEPYRTRKISKYIHELTCEERDKLLNLTFIEMWVSVGSAKRDFQKAATKWETLDIQSLLPNYVCSYKEADYLIPKGRLKCGESVRQCALREFSEETGYMIRDVTLLNLDPYEEVFTGTDGKKYKNVFFIAKMNQNAKVVVKLGDDIQQSKEVRNMGWFSLSQCDKLIRDYHICKKQILFHANDSICQEIYRENIDIEI